MEISQELVERCVALVRDIAAGGLTTAAIGTEARAIVAELPAPVDPDLVEARRVAERQSSARGYLYDPEGFWQGHRDDGDDVQIALAAIRRGRELAAIARSAQS